MNNEPVAWMVAEMVFDTEEAAIAIGKTYDDAIIPLYTHPVKEQYKFGVDWSKNGNAVTVLKICEDGVAEVVFMDYQEVTHPIKELTDEEIQELALSDEFWISEDCTIFDWHKFARAILKKAQQK